LLLADDRVPNLLGVIPLLWSFIGNSAAFLFGMYVDLVLMLAGLTWLSILRSKSDLTR